MYNMEANFSVRCMTEYLLYGRPQFFGSKVKNSLFNFGPLLSYCVCSVCNSKENLAFSAFRTAETCQTALCRQVSYKNVSLLQHFIMTCQKFPMTCNNIRTMKGVLSFLIHKAPSHKPTCHPHTRLPETCKFSALFLKRGRPYLVALSVRA